MVRLPRGLTSVSVGFVVLVALYLLAMPQGCADVAGVPSWERCWTIVNSPAFSTEDWGLSSSFDILIPVIPAILLGYITWWLLGLRDPVNA